MGSRPSPRMGGGEEIVGEGMRGLTPVPGAARRDSRGGGGRPTRARASFPGARRRPSTERPSPGSGGPPLPVAPAEVRRTTPLPLRPADYLSLPDPPWPARRCSGSPAARPAEPAAQAAEPRPPHTHWPTATCDWLPRVDARSSRWAPGVAPI